MDTELERTIMEQAVIIREPSMDQGTLGHLVTQRGFQCYILELPNYDNVRSYSCIPLGDYVVRVRRSPKYGLVFHLTDVEGRQYILMHSGNWAGDVHKGFKTHSKGCLLFGYRRGVMGGQRAVFNSRSAKAGFERHMGLSRMYENEVTFKLHIMEVW